MRAVVAVAVLALSLAGCSAQVEVGGESDTGSPTATTEQPADLRTYVSPKYGFSFQYAPPFEEQKETTWEAKTAESSDESAAVFDTSGSQVGGQYRDAFVVNVYQLGTQITDENLPQVATELEQSVIPQLEKSGEDMQINDLVSTEVNGLKGFQTDATFSVEGTPMSSTLYFLFDGDLEYQLLTQSTSDRWEQLQPTFDAIVDSFTVGAATTDSPTSG